MNVKRMWGIFCLSLVTMAVSAQSLRVEGGFGISSLRNWSVPVDADIPDLFENKIYPFQFAVGVAYLDRGWFHLSSNIGVMRKGGKDKVYNYDLGSGTAVSEDDWTYAGTFLTLNTLFDVKKTSYDGYTFYAGVGPSLNIKLGEGEESDGFESDMGNFSDRFCPVNLGLRCELGIKKQFGRTAIGLVAAYHPTLTHLIKESDVKDRTFTIGITLDMQLARKNSARQ